jgi:hypothetical protein
MSEQTVAFLRHILPANGLRIACVIANGRVAQRIFETNEQLAQFLASADANRQDAYQACATYRDREGVYIKGKWRIRCQPNVLLVLCLWADIDTREGQPDAPYADRREAWEAVIAFCQVSGMPPPVFVSSGYGLHIYWVLCEPLSESEWRKYAKRLAALFAAMIVRDDLIQRDSAGRL